MARSPIKAKKESDVTPRVEESLDFDEDALLRAKAEEYKNKGNDEYRKKEFSNAEKLYTEGIKINCKDDDLNAKLYSNRATAHFYLGNYHESLDDAKAAIELQPAYVKAIDRAASSCVELHLYEEAITWCDKGLAISKDNRTLLDLRKRSVDVVRKFPELTDQEKANSNSERETAEREESEDSNVYEVIGNIFIHSRDYKAAIHYYLRYLKIAEQLGDRAGQGRAYSNLGNAYFDLGNFKAAIRHHERDLEIAVEMRDRKGEGRALGNIGIAYYSLGDVTRAVHYYENSINIAQKVGDRVMEGNSRANLGIAYQHLGDFEKAIDYHELHLKIVKELGDRAGEANAYFSLGNIDLRQGNFAKALEYHECALKIAKEIGDRVSEGVAYAILGNDYSKLRNLKKAIDCHQQHLKIVEKLGNKAGMLDAYCNLGGCYQDLGETETAIDYYDRLLKIAQEVGDRGGEGSAYRSLGNAYISLKNFTKAIDYYERQLKIAQEIRNRAGEGNAYGNLGNAYITLGNFTKAIDYNERRLKIDQEIRNRAGEGKAYGNLGIAYHNLRNFEKAKDNLERGLEIHKELGDKSAEGVAYGNLGNVYHSLGDFKKAIACHEMHLKDAQELQNRAEEGYAYGHLAVAYQSLGNFNKAIEYYALSLQIAKEVGDKDGEARTSYNLGCSCAALGFLSYALEFFQSSVEIFNALRARLQSKDEWKISLRHMYQAVYNSLWSLLLEQGKVVEALSAAEQGRAQALIDLLELNYFGNERPCVGSSPEEKSMNAILSCLPSNTVFMAVHEREIVYWVIQKEKDVEVRRQEIDDNSAVDATTFLQSLIENACEKLGVRAGVRFEDRSLDKLKYDMQSHERSGQTACYSLEIRTSALRTLYDVVIGPIEDLIRGSDELTIAPDGPLCLVPYAALMDPRSKYLGESFRIRVIPSLSSLKLITDCPENHHCKSGALLVGDPCVKELSNVDGKKLNQLPSAIKEVEMIGRIINCAPLTGKEATKNKVLERISSVALVHIAAHGRMETGEIVLAPNLVPESAQVQEEDYLLTMEDVLKIKLRARLVVLSCCHSARGKIKAEGVVGIARAFLGAGARSVLVSLWAIDDEATLEFMKFFYQHLLDGRKASEALRLAMKCMRESENELFSEVKHWAPFVLIGDDVTLEFGGAE
ncbi:uncharacterized protein LOC144628777 [Oculina patagonica]